MALSWPQGPGFFLGSNQQDDDWAIPSGKHTKSYGKSPCFFDGKTHYQWPFSIAMDRHGSHGSPIR